MPLTPGANFKYLSAKIFLDIRCQQCHNSAPRVPLVTFYDVKNAGMTRNLSARINRQAGVQPMPPTDTLTPQEKQWVTQWIDAGYPQN